MAWWLSAAVPLPYVCVWIDWLGCAAALCVCVPRSYCRSHTGLGGCWMTDRCWHGFGCVSWRPPLPSLFYHAQQYTTIVDYAERRGATVGVLFFSVLFF